MTIDGNEERDLGLIPTIISSCLSEKLSSALVTLVDNLIGSSSLIIGPWPIDTVPKSA